MQLQLQVLSKGNRNLLARASMQAREIAENAARKALHAMGIDEPDPRLHLTAEERVHRRSLRAQAKQLGDRQDTERKGRYILHRLVEKIAYDQWHRLLFARFLLENQLLISPDHDVSVSLDDCRDLAPELGLSDGWDVACRFAVSILPEIFRYDDPAGRIELAPEDKSTLRRIVSDLPAEVFHADDSLGWVYQFWQARMKELINRSGNKIAADTLAPVTQLFTEDYMVLFLLHNTLGAWWTSKRLKEGLPVKVHGLEFTYLRTLDDGSPVAGGFDGWPRAARDLKFLDPCMGSTHFLVFALPIFVAFRMEEEGLDRAAACEAVLRDNLFGLELDPRCTQIAAFNLALAAWKMGGYRPLPHMNLACCGQGINSRRDEWLKLANGDSYLETGMDRLYSLFEQAPDLGSLIDPRKQLGGDLYTATFEEVAELLDAALAKERIKGDETLSEMGVTAQGLARAGSILADRFHLVATNVPYLARGKQDDILRKFCEKHHPEAKNDLATCFLERCLSFCEEGGTTALVTPQNWLFLTTYKRLRQKLLKTETWHLIARLGEGGFESSAAAGAFTILITMSRGNVARDRRELPGETGDGNLIRGMDVSDLRSAPEKAAGLLSTEIKSIEQAKQLENPDARIALEKASELHLMSKYAASYQGITTGDNPRFIFNFWETNSINNEWRTFQSTGDEPLHYSGRNQVFLWENGEGYLASSDAARIQGQVAWEAQGVSVRQMRELPPTLNSGSPWDMNCATVVPQKLEDLPAIWCFCSSPEYNEAVRRIDQKLNVTNATLVKVPFDLDYWTRAAEKQYPNGLPKPYTDDPTQWIFHGHPCGSVVWDEEQKWTAHGPLRSDDTVLQVAVARLLGYRWPAEQDQDMELAEEQRHWVERCEALLPLVDEDGIVCIHATKGQSAASERLRTLLVHAYGTEWSTARQADLLDRAGFTGKSLDDWLRNGFFEQHCKMFQQRPFIWQIWDGRKDGFSALVNYHRLNHGCLSKLIYAYLGDWIARQRASAEAGEEGSDGRLSAALVLKEKLEKILEGEPPYDIFVRWKPLDAQPIGWNPDLNDGVRLNIRPFIKAGVLRKDPKINWKKDRGKEVSRPKEQFPWFWGWDERTEDWKGGAAFTGDRWNDCHYSGDAKRKARGQ